MSSFGGLSIALSSLLSQRRAMDVTGQNVANASTVGYTRQRADLQALGPVSLHSLQGATLPYGSGVTVAGVVRLSDELAAARVRSSTADHGFLTTRADLLAQVETRFAEPGDDGLQAALGELWQSFGDLSNSPGDPAARVAVLQQAARVTDLVHTGQRGASVQWQETRAQAGALQTEVNTLAGSVAQLNKHIRESDGQAHELTDQRDQLVLRLAELTGATAQLRPDGTARVLVGGIPLVDGDRATTVTLQAPQRIEDVTASAPVRFTWPDGSTVSGGGVLSALTEGMQTTLPGVVAGYDEVATALATKVNALHAGGQAPDGSTGRPFFVLGTGSAAGTIAVNPDLMADPMLLAAAAGGAGALDGSLADRLAGLATAEGGPDQLWGRFVVRTGVEVGALDGRAAVAARVAATAQDALLSETGVDLDEEMTNLVMFQRAYEGAARVMTAVDQALDTLINRTGVVGR
jgi:flagellar hook-associated protein 1 FlgK